MEVDPDVALPSIEQKEGTGSPARTPSSDTLRNVSSRTNTSRTESSLSRTPLKTPRTRPSTPSTRSTSRSPSVASVRNEKATPKLDKKRSVPNLTVPSSTPHQPQFRRASSNLNPATPLRIKMERLQMTSASVTKDYFRKELESHATTNSKVVFFAHDACYGHRFARPKATKAMLGSIVERPERIHATLLGASTAYVRLGERHKDGRYFPQPDSEVVESPTPPFTIRRSTRSIPLNHAAVTDVHGTKWMESLQVMCDSAEAKLAMGQKELARPIGHSKDSKGNTLPPLHSGDLYLAGESLAALQGCLGGVCDAVDTVFQQGPTQRAFVCIRPPGHHCSAEMPSGFCWLNNVHVGISYAASNHGLTHAAIIDFDLHHGDGSQTVTWDHNRSAHNTQNPKAASAYKKTPIGYYSVHDINSYPCEYGDEEKVKNASTCLHNSHGQSIWNVHLEPWKTHADFWTLYETKYKVLLEKARSFLQHRSDLLRNLGIEPKAAIFLSAGFDASEWESEFMQRHEVNVPTDFYAKITADIVQLADQPELGVGGRVISVLEGGYSDRALTSGVLSHLCGLTSTIEHDPPTELPQGLSGFGSEASSSDIVPYDPTWWSRDHLELLEAMVSGNLPAPAKPKDKSSSSYYSPTHASTAKMTEVAKERKSLTTQLEARLMLENSPPEPIPEVDWVTSAYELSRLLIPQDRQTLSCTHEDLNAEAARARRDQQSLASVPPSDVFEKMQLRDRKPRQANLGYAAPRAASRTTSRRTTIAAASELTDSASRGPSRSRRRSSAASSVISGFHDLKLDGTDETISTRTPPSTGTVSSSKTTVALPVKKTRAPVKKPVSANSSPRKAKAQPQTSASLSTVRENSVVDTSGDKKIAPAASDANSTANKDGMDELTSGMKKISIKLKMPTEEEHNAKQRVATDTTTTKTKTTRKPPVPKVTKTRAVVGITGAAQNGATQPTVPLTPNDNSCLIDYTSTAAPAAPSTDYKLKGISDVRTEAPYTADTEAGDEQMLKLYNAKVRTMPALEFLSYPTSETKSTFAGDRQAGDPTTNTSYQDSTIGSTGASIEYPTIDMEMSSLSPPLSQQLEKQEHRDSSSVWDFSETPRR